MNIGQAAKASGVSQRMIRHYEKVGLIPAPARRDSGYRDYSDSDVQRLAFIANARDLGFSITEIRDLLNLWADDHRASADVKSRALEKANELQRKADALSTMRASLLHLAGNCHGDDRPDCPIIEGMVTRACAD
ncbi:MAG: Cu(I)-responsive transcriptional regulator [Sphingomonadaceae bacterium]|nr:MAG: Cu(I)-responsive transcriptional regulator [Sphingomonadaceae bacterium]